jgi:hypothetical protein
VGGGPGGKRENQHVIQEILPIYDLRLSFQIPTGKELARVTLEPGGTELTTSLDGARATVRVPKLSVHAAVVAHWSD